ncbi:MAG: hypothetical protein U0361_17170 [Nitrospiraceae bacterium]
MIAGTERKLRSERREEIVARRTVAGQARTEEGAGFGVLRAAGMGPVDLAVEGEIACRHSSGIARIKPFSLLEGFDWFN